jgi:hypothetical protein
MTRREIESEDQISYHKRDKKDYLAILKNNGQLLVNQIYVQWHRHLSDMWIISEQGYKVGRLDFLE